MMETNFLDQLIQEKIPISNAFGIKFREATPEIFKIFAPFANNATFKNTAFGGSLHAISTIACWSFLYVNLLQMNQEYDLVITHSQVDYLRPVTEDIVAFSYRPEERLCSSFEKILLAKGKARITIPSKIFQKDEVAVNYQGTFVALKKRN